MVTSHYDRVLTVQDLNRPKKSSAETAHDFLLFKDRLFCYLELADLVQCIRRY